RPYRAFGGGGDLFVPWDFDRFRNRRLLCWESVRPAGDNSKDFAGIVRKGCFTVSQRIAWTRSNACPRYLRLSTYSFSNSRNRLVCTRLTGTSVLFLSSMR